MKSAAETAAPYVKSAVSKVGEVAGPALQQAEPTIKASADAGFRVQLLARVSTQGSDIRGHGKRQTWELRGSGIMLIIPLDLQSW